MLPANHGSTSIEENRSYCRYKFYMAGIRHFALKHNALAQRKVRPNATFIARSPILAPIESPYATSYTWIIVTHLLSCSVSEIWWIIWSIFPVNEVSVWCTYLRIKETCHQKLETSLYRVVQSIFQYLEQCRHDLWATDGRTLWQQRPPIHYIAWPNTANLSQLRSVHSYRQHHLQCTGHMRYYCLQQHSQLEAY